MGRFTDKAYSFRRRHAKDIDPDDCVRDAKIVDIIVLQIIIVSDSRFDDDGKNNVDVVRIGAVPCWTGRSTGLVRVCANK